MTTLALNKPRAYEEGFYNDLPVKGSTKIYEGAALGKASGYARPLVAADVFLGFSQELVDNSAGADGAKNVRTRQRGKIVLDVVGVTGVTNEGATVYASDDDTFTLTSSGNTAVGKISRWMTGTRCVVEFEAASTQSI